eukprot:CAMPEP_0119131430 /NCGR_PEP_ID=MMETSP1310-20130426/10385_1 /TAXON_ID=464262 /ORGANISM="Genus nov. species nov., Strain RCC2339" /LENGTH=187 /DNA_ID=CAMNT_0007122003 /DNA_START=132 /DNA_END=692 /DNA_ORIENTATION=-
MADKAGPPPPPYFNFGARVRVCIMSGSDLLASDLNGFSDPYCKISFESESGKSEMEKKTSVKKKTLNPVWNEVLDFSFPAILKPGRVAYMVIRIYDADRFGSDDFLGEVRIPTKDILANPSSVEDPPNPDHAIALGGGEGEDGDWVVVEKKVEDPECKAKKTGKVPGTLMFKYHFYDSEWASLYKSQ